MAGKKETSRSKNTTVDQGRDQDVLGGRAESNSIGPQETHGESARSIGSKDNYKKSTDLSAPISATSSAILSKSCNKPRSTYSSTVKVHVPEPLNVIKTSVDDLSSSPSSGVTARAEVTNSPVKQKPVEIHEPQSSHPKRIVSSVGNERAKFLPTVVQSSQDGSRLSTKARFEETAHRSRSDTRQKKGEFPEGLDSSFLGQATPGLLPGVQDKEHLGYMGLDSNAASSKNRAEIGTDKISFNGSPPNQSPSPNPSILQDTSPKGAQGSIKSQSSPPTPYNPGKEVQKPSYPSLKFIEEGIQWDENWDGDGGPTGTQKRDPNMPKNKAPLLGDRPPMVAGPSKAEIDAQARFVANELKEVATDPQQQMGVAEEVLQLRTKVKALKMAGRRKAPDQLNEWKSFVDTYLRGATEKLSVGAAVDLGSSALEMAIQLGVEQTNQILTLRYENNQLKREVILLRKDAGAGADYPSPDEFEEMKAMWFEDLKTSSAKLKKAEERLKSALADASVSNKYNEVATKAKQKNKRLGEELGELRIEKDGLERDKSAYKAQIDKLRNALDDEKSRNEVLEGRKDQTGTTKSRSENEERRLRLKVVRLEKDVKARSGKISFLLAKIAELEGRDSTQHLPSGSNPNNSQLKIDGTVTEELENEAEDEINIIEIAILRIKLRLNNLVRERAQCGPQPDDAVGAAELGWDALSLCEKMDNECALVRISFWLGIALYYNDNIQEARFYFQKANMPEVLPEYEVTYLPGWLALCNKGTPGKCSADIEASPSEVTRQMGNLFGWHGRDQRTVSAGI